MTAEDETFQKWTKWIDTIHTDVADLVIGRHIFWEVQDIIKANPKIQKPSSFYGLLGMTYGAWGSMGVRRQLDNDSVSLKRLLSQMAQTPQILSRQRYVAAYAVTLMGSSNVPPPISQSDKLAEGGTYALDRSEAEEIANRSFDKYAGHSDSHVPKDTIEQDISQLRNLGERVKVFADKKIAHLVERQPITLPTLNDLDACIDLLERLVLKYERILKRSAPQSLLPTWQYDWKAIFCEPWIPGCWRQR